VMRRHSSSFLLRIFFRSSDRDRDRESPCNARNKLRYPQPKRSCKASPNPLPKAASKHTHPPTHSLSLSPSLSLCGSFTAALRQRTTKGARKQYPPFNCTPKTAPPTRLQPQFCALQQHSRTWRHLPRQGLGFRVELGTERERERGWSTRFLLLYIALGV
jgi:hypothetical protein